MKPLKSTTALVMCLSLSVPAPLLAQGQGNTEVCGDDPNPPCMTDLGNILLPAKGKAKKLELCEGEDTLPCRTEEGFLLVDAASEDAEEAMTELTSTAVESGEAAEGGEAAVGGEVAVGGDAVGDETALAEALEEDAAAAEAETEVATSEGEAAEGSTIEEDTTASTETAPAEGDEVEMVQIEESEGVEMTEAPTDEPESDGEAEVMVETETEAEMAAETEVTEVESEGETEVMVETEAEAEAEVEVVENPEIVQEVDEGIVEVEEAAVGAAAAMEETAEGEVAEGVEVEEEEVTEETARSSDEDFETTASGDASASASSGDSGLSKFEKALLVGLGAVAVGSILNNGDEVVSNSGDRLVVRDEDGSFRVLKDDDALLRQPGSQVRTETFGDGSTRTTVTKEDGSKIVTIRAADGRVVRRARVFNDGSQVVLFDDTEAFEPVDVSELPDINDQPQGRLLVDTSDEDALRVALAAELSRDMSRSYSLRQIRQIRKVRELAPEIELDAITFRSGSAAIEPSQAEELATLGRAMARAIEERPGEVFLIEGHTDAVGAATYNLALSDRRAETVALALTEYFDVPPENMITQGYGEAYLKVRTLADERANRRATVRRITPLLRQTVASNN